MCYYCIEQLVHINKSTMKTIRQYNQKAILQALALFFVLGMCLPGISVAQHHKKEHKEHSEHVFKNQRKNILMLSFGYTYVPKGSSLHHHESDGVFVPSIGLDYKRRLSEKWALSVFTDWELDHYLLINKEYSRDRAFIAVLGASYEIAEGTGLFAGVGKEFEKHQDLMVVRVGLEHGFDLGKHWVVVPSVFYDWKEHYDTYSFSLGLSYKF